MIFDKPLNILINSCVIANSIECFSRESNGHASVAYNSTGMHFALNKVKTVSSEAVPPILLYIALKALKILTLTWSKEQLHVRPLTKFTQRLRQLSTHLNVSP